MGNRDRKYEEEDGVTCGGNFEEGLKEGKELALRTSGGGFSGRRNISCKYQRRK